MGNRWIPVSSMTAAAGADGGPIPMSNANAHQDDEYIAGKRRRYPHWSEMCSMQSYPGTAQLTHVAIGKEKSLSSRLRHPVYIRRMISFGQPKRYFIRIASTLLSKLGGTKTEKMIPTSHKRSSFRMPYGTALNFRKLRTTRC
ncbi:hypothetical protein P7H19_21615 [Paenibacillus larvae]|nr:hypothetical protein [Paenibacillus larvae]MDT2238352.1 hypothetical protein [Paenibacillus larvae]